MKKNKKTEYIDFFDIREAVDFAGVGLYRYKLDGTIEYINKAAFYILELDRKYADSMDVLGKKLGDLILCEDIEQKVMEALKNTSLSDSVEYNFKTLSGSDKCLIHDSYLIRDDKTGEELVNVIVTDFSECISNRNKFREVSAKYEAMIEAFDGYIYICSSDYKIEYMNKKFVERLGYYPKGQPCYKSIHGLDGNCDWCVNDKVVKGETVKWETFSQQDNCWYYIVKAPIYNNDGSVSIIAMAQDITSRKQAEEKTRWLSRIPEQIGKGIRVRSLSGGLLFVNKVFSDMYGYSEDELNGRNINSIHNDKEITEINELNAKALANETYTMDMWHSRKDGTIFPVQITSSSFKDSQGEVIGFIDILIDITERKELEVALLQLQDMSNNYLDVSEVMMLSIGADGNVRYINKKGCSILGYSKDEVIGKNWFDNFLPERLVKNVKSIFDSILSGSIDKNEYLAGAVLCKNGDERLIRYHHLPVYGKDGKIAYILSSGEDITEKQKMETAIKESEEKYRTLVENLNVGVYRVLCDYYGSFIHVNNAFLNITGYKSLDELQAKTMVELYNNPMDMELMAEAILRKGYIKNLKICLRKKDGSVVTVTCTAIAHKDSEGNIKYVDGIIEDITENLRIEEELKKTRNLESLGILAGGIAHDFNNLLTGVLGYISLAMLHVTPEDQVMKMLEESERACLRAKELTKQLLTFSKGGKPILNRGYVDSVVTETVRFALRGFSGIECQFVKEQGLWPSNFDEPQIKQLITNLTLNAAQSMPEGGKIVVRLENVNIQADEKLKDGQYVKVSIKDTGVGIPEENMGKIFDPYFTTKANSAGIGLSAAYSIIKRHCGEITIESKTNAGTEISFYLPAGKADDPAIENNATIKKASRVKILVMDDEEIIRNFLSNLLNRLGYDALCVSDGESLVLEYKKAIEAKHPFGLVIMDIIIPDGMGGKEAISKLIEIDPNVKAIVASAYSNDPIMSDYKTYGFKGRIEKPFKITELTQVISKTISEDKF